MGYKAKQQREVSCDRWKFNRLEKVRSEETDQTTTQNAFLIWRANDNDNDMKYKLSIQWQQQHYWDVYNS